MSSPQQIFRYDEESQSDKLARKTKDSPFMIIGLTGLVGIVGYGAYQFKRSKLSTSMFLIHLRVAAQGFVVSALTVGIAYQMFENYMNLKSDKKKDE